MLDFNLLGAVRAANLWSVESWVTYWSDGGGHGGREAPMRICPECAALVVNENNLLQMHAQTHRPRAVTPTRFAGVPYSEQPGTARPDLIPGSHYVPGGPTSGGEAA